MQINPTEFLVPGEFVFQMATGQELHRKVSQIDDQRFEVISSMGDSEAGETKEVYLVAPDGIYCHGAQIPRSENGDDVRSSSPVLELPAAAEHGQTVAKSDRLEDGQLSLLDVTKWEERPCYVVRTATDAITFDRWWVAGLGIVRERFEWPQEAIVNEWELVRRK
ncbi:MULTISPECIES: hypothetical protein [unclassified Deinococcus]|jgi:hypothetical protein|uniref:hypothetical protein n=1 Tax=unclassified Deinococcus TaxID=2623546 RepID=UPI00117C3892|nr:MULTISPECIES: hypothetical protein [unclassified Deinococcus]MBX8467220.1 hypothetical protein [Deinococcus sp. RIT780]NTX99334.1 hypothetical protein [Deinococcus sp. JMULE3]